MRDTLSKNIQGQIFKELRGVIDSFGLSGLVSESLGVGTAEDKLTSFDNYSFKILTPNVARRLYANSDILQNIVDLPAFDATREGFTLTSKYDEQGASEMIMERLEELNINDILRQHLENYSLYSRGSILFPVIRETFKPEYDQRLSINTIDRIESLNVLSEDDFEFYINTTDPFSSAYMRPENAFIRGDKVHPSRYRWSVYKFFPLENMGVSMIQKVMLACLALRITNWSLASVMLEVQNKVLKVEDLDSYAQQDATPDFRSSTGNAASRVINYAKRWLTSSKMMVINKNDDYQRQMYSASGTKEATDFFWEYLASVRGIPQSKIKGQATGTISSADVDEKRYVSSIRAHEQNKILKPCIKYLINLLKCEQRGKFYKKFALEAHDIQFDIEFNKIWQPDENEFSTIKLRDSQRGQVDIAAGVRGADQVRRELYPDLGDEPLPEMPEDMTAPAISQLELFNGAK